MNFSVKLGLSSLALVSFLGGVAHALSDYGPTSVATNDTTFVWAIDTSAKVEQDGANYGSGYVGWGQVTGHTGYAQPCSTYLSTENVIFLYTINGDIIYNQTVVGDGWDGWNNLSSPTLDAHTSIGCSAAPSNNDIHVFVTSGGHIWESHAIYGGGGSAFSMTSGINNVSSTVTATTHPTGGSDLQNLFWTDNTGKMHFGYFSSGVAYDQGLIPGQGSLNFASNAPAAVWAGNILYVFGTDTTTHEVFMTRYYIVSGSTFYSWQGNWVSVGTFTSDYGPAASVLTNNVLFLYATDTAGNIEDNQMGSANTLSGVFSGWNVVPGTF